MELEGLPLYSVTAFKLYLNSYEIYFDIILPSKPSCVLESHCG